MILILYLELPLRRRSLVSDAFLTDGIFPSGLEMTRKD